MAAVPGARSTRVSHLHRQDSSQACCFRCSLAAPRNDRCDHTPFGDAKGSKVSILAPFAVQLSRRSSQKGIEGCLELLCEDILGTVETNTSLLSDCDRLAGYWMGEHQAEVHVEASLEANMPLTPLTQSLFIFACQMCSRNAQLVMSNFPWWKHWATRMRSAFKRPRENICINAPQLALAKTPRAEAGKWRPTQNLEM